MPNDTNECPDKAIDMLIQTINDPLFYNLACQEQSQRLADVDIGFNLFNLISDVYHRENFHSDIIRAILDPSEKHGQGSMYLNSFIDFIVEKSDARLSIDHENYKNVKVYRERGRIDVQICDDTSKHAIIIENKINRARDMPRQLPRYAEELTQKGYHIDAIVYLLLNYHLMPDMLEWTEEDRKLVQPKLIIVAANDGSNADLASGWLRVCLKNTNDPDSKSILKQYQLMLKKIGKKAMEKNIMEQFYTEVIHVEKYKTLQSLNRMYIDLAVYRIERILEIYKDNHQPFESVWNWKNQCAVFESFRHEGTSFSLDIYHQDNSYNLQFFERVPGRCNATSLLSLIDEERNFVQNGERMERSFKFPEQEKELYRFIDSFLIRLRDIAYRASSNSNSVTDLN